MSDRTYAGIATFLFYISGSQNVSGPPASVSPGNALKMQNFRSEPRPTDSETVDVGPQNLHFNNLPGDSNALKFGTACSDSPATHAQIRLHLDTYHPRLLAKTSRQKSTTK